MADKFRQKRPRRQDFIDQYGFEGDAIWRLELLKYEEAKNEWDRYQKGLKKYQNMTPAEKELKDKETNKMAEKKKKEPREIPLRVGRAGNRKKQSQESKQTKPIKMADGEKIPKGVDKVVLSKDVAGESHVIMTITNTGFGAKKTVKDKAPSAKKTAAKPAAKATPAQPKKVAQKPAVKRSEPKSSAPKKEPTSVKKPASAKKSAADKLLMHNDKDEMKVDSKKPIVINGANIKPKPVPKVLRRVAKSGGYTAWDDIKRNGKTFATEQEAKDYVADVLKKTGKIVPISPTDRQVTHTFKPEEEKKKK